MVQGYGRTKSWTEIDGDDRKVVIWMETGEVYDRSFLKIYAVDLYWGGE